MRGSETQFVSIREKPDIIQRIETLAEDLGTDRSSWIRGAIREKLAREPTAKR